MPTVDGGTFFASMNCTGSRVSTVASPGTISFRPALANGRPLVGSWMLTASTNGVSVPTFLTLGAQVTAPVTRLQVGVCTALATPSFTGVMTSTPVAFWQDVVLDGFTLPSTAFMFCGPSAVTIPANMGAPIVPSISVRVLTPGTSTLTGNSQTVGLTVASAFALTTCMADGGSAGAVADCCNSTTASDGGGIICQ